MRLLSGRDGVKPLFAIALLVLCATPLKRASAQAETGPLPKEIRVTLLGTASGPRVHPNRAGVSTLIESGSERLLFDAGRGVMQRLVEAG
jgi:ribonuclease Z